MVMTVQNLIDELEKIENKNLPLVVSHYASEDICGNTIFDCIEYDGFVALDLAKDDLFITFEEPLKGKCFDNNQMRDLYAHLVRKSDYKDYIEWLEDMLRSGVFERM